MKFEVEVETKKTEKEKTNEINKKREEIMKEIKTVFNRAYIVSSDKRLVTSYDRKSPETAQSATSINKINEGVELNEEGVEYQIQLLK